MKYNSLFLPIISLLVLSGCRSPWQRLRKPKPQKTIVMPAKIDDQAHKKLLFFDEQINDLEESEQYVFNQVNELKSPKIFDQALPADRKELELSLDEFHETPDQEIQLVYFDYDDTNIRKDQKARLAKLKEKIEEWSKKGYTIVFKGHACKCGKAGRDYNLALSNSRAHQIAKTCGLGLKKVKIFGVGNEEPVSFETTKEGQAPNRRVEAYAIAA